MNKANVYNQIEENTKSGVTDFARRGNPLNNSFYEMAGQLS